MRRTPGVALLVLLAWTSCAPSVRVPGTPPAPDDATATEEPRSRDDYLALSTQTVEAPAPNVELDCQPHRSPACSDEIWSCACGFGNYGSGGGTAYEGRCFAERRDTAAQSAKATEPPDSDEVHIVVLGVSDEAFCGYARNEAEPGETVECGITELVRCVIVDIDPCDGSVTTVCDGDFDEKGEEQWSPDGLFVWRHTFDPPSRELLFEEVHRPPPQR